MEKFILNIDDAIKYKLDCNVDKETIRNKMKKIKINDKKIYDVF